jgi:hypothetical protein
MKQYLGYPIVADVIYGARQGSSASVEASRAMLHSVRADTSESRIDSVTDIDVENARRACSCCSADENAIGDIFSREQLLRGGHELFLHALRYRIAIGKRKSTKCKTEADPPDETMVVLDFEVDPPHWMEQGLLEEVTWLA